jgi:hypothetical protein
MTDEIDEPNKPEPRIVAGGGPTARSIVESDLGIVSVPRVVAGGESVSIFDGDYKKRFKEIGKALRTPRREKQRKIEPNEIAAEAIRYAKRYQQESKTKQTIIDALSEKTVDASNPIDDLQSEIAVKTPQKRGPHSKDEDIDAIEALQQGRDENTVKQVWWSDPRMEPHRFSTEKSKKRTWQAIKTKAKAGMEG